MIRFKLNFVDIAVLNAVYFSKFFLVVTAVKLAVRKMVRNMGPLDDIYPGQGVADPGELSASSYSIDLFNYPKRK